MLQGEGTPASGDEKMKIKNRLSIIWIIAVMALVIPAAALADSVGWVCGLEGESTIERPGKGSVAAIVGIGVEMGDVISTSPDGRIKILFVDDSVVSLGADTRVKISEFVFDPANKDRHSLLELLGGKLRLLVGKLFGVETNVKVQTPTAVAGVSGTIFAIDYSPEKNLTRVLTIEGAVAVSSANPSLNGLFTVTAGEITIVQRDEFPEEARTATSEELQSLMGGTEVSNKADLSQMPGRGGEIKDNPLIGSDNDAFGAAFTDSEKTPAQGASATEFDAYVIETDAVLDVDLPWPGDFHREVAGFKMPEDRSAKVTVGVDIEKPEKNDD